MGEKMGVEKKLGVKKNRSKEIPLNFKKEIPLIFYREFPLNWKLTKNRQKLTCSKFFDKIKNFYFFWFFHKRCLKKSSEGSKNNQKKISRCFREICEFVFKKSKKKPTPDFGEIFWKIYFFLNFLSFSQKISWSTF